MRGRGPAQYSLRGGGTVSTITCMTSSDQAGTASVSAPTELDPDATAREPQAWSAFIEYVKTEERSRRLQAAYDFRARWRFANAFEGITTRGYAPRGNTALGYHALLRHVVACTAHEQLGTVVGKPVQFMRLEDSALADRIRKHFHADGDTAFMKSLQKGRLAETNEDLKGFWAGTSDELQVLCILIRNGVAHGSLTPTGMGLGQRDRLAALIELTDSLLADADARFTAWVERKVALKTKAALGQPKVKATSQR